MVCLHIFNLKPHIFGSGTPIPPLLFIFQKLLLVKKTTKTCFYFFPLLVTKETRQWGLTQWKMTLTCIPVVSSSNPCNTLTVCEKIPSFLTLTKEETCYISDENSINLTSRQAAPSIHINLHTSFLKEARQDKYNLSSRF